MKITTPSPSSLPVSDRPLDGWPFRRTMLVVGAVAVVATALAFFLAPQWGLAIALVLVVAGFLLRKGPLMLLSLTAAVCILATVCHHQFRVARVERMAGQRVTLTGQVTDHAPSGAMITLTVTQCPQLPRGTRLAVYCPEGSLSLFDITTLEVDLIPLPSQAGTWQRQGVFLFALPTGWDYEEGRPFAEGETPLAHALQRPRLWLRRLVRTHLPAGQGDLLSALCLGFKSDVPTAVSDAFRGSGLSHLLVVSGLHLSTLALAMMALLRRLIGQRPAAGVTALTVALFVWMMDGAPSVGRAGVMCLIWLGGYFCRRRPDGFNSLGLALLLLLLYNPYLLWDAGFQLSFCATAGVLLWCGRLPAPPTPLPDEPRHRFLWRRWCYGLRGAVTVSLGATVATLPLICHYFGDFSVAGPVANLLAVTPAGFALLIGWLGMLLCAVPVLSFVGQPLLLVAAKVMDGVAWIAQLCSPAWAVVPTTQPRSVLLVSGVCLLVMCAVGFRIPKRRWMPAVGWLTLCGGSLLILTM